MRYDYVTHYEKTLKTKQMKLYKPIKIETFLLQIYFPIGFVGRYEFNIDRDYKISDMSLKCWLKYYLKPYKKYNEIL